jgi:hypothetical protein
MAAAQTLHIQYSNSFYQPGLEFLCQFHFLAYILFVDNVKLTLNVFALFFLKKVSTLQLWYFTAG